jgi:hypothetical protein
MLSYLVNQFLLFFFFYLYRILGYFQKLLSQLFLLYIFLFWVVLGIELGALHLLGKCSITCPTPLVQKLFNLST